MEVQSKSTRYFLKQPVKKFFIEVAVIDKLSKLCSITNIPTVVAKNNELNCFLTQSCGVQSLRDVFQNGFDINLFIKGIKTYRNIQLSTVNNIQDFLNISVPDWRIEKYPSLYIEAISDTNYLIDNGLSSTQINTLQSLVPRIQSLCDELSQFNISNSFSASDLHDGNMILNENGEIFILDLGEAAIDNQIFSLSYCLSRISGRYNIYEKSMEYSKLKVACFEEIAPSYIEINKAHSIVKKLLPFYFFLIHKRLFDSTDPVEMKKLVKMNTRIKDSFLGIIKENN